MTIKLNGSTAGSVSLDAPASTTSSADIAFKLPVADGSAGQVLMTDGSGNLSWVTLPTVSAAMVDTWRLITQYINEQGTLGDTSDWERDDTYGKGLLGAGMSHANGYFTFPSTGFYSVRFYGHHSMSYSDGRSINGEIVYTANNF